MRQRLGRAAGACVMTGGLFLPGLRGAEVQSFLFPGGTEVEIVAALLAPGQIILARLVQAPEIKRVLIRFLDNVYELGPKERALENFALIGLDLDIKPGPYEIDM